MASRARTAPAALGLCTLGPPRGLTTGFPGVDSLEPLGVQSLLALASQSGQQPLLALCLVSMVSTTSASVILTFSIASTFSTVLMALMISPFAMTSMI